MSRQREHRVLDGFLRAVMVAKDEMGRPGEAREGVANELREGVVVAGLCPPHKVPPHVPPSRATVPRRRQNMMGGSAG